MLKRDLKNKRGMRVRSKLKKSSHLRLSAFRSSKHIYVQVIDDANGKTILSVSSHDDSFKNEEITFETDESKNKSKATSVKSKTKKNNERSIKKKTIKEKGKDKKTEKDQLTNSSKTKNKSPKATLKEIKNKKTGWWQK